MLRRITPNLQHIAINSRVPLHAIPHRVSSFAGSHQSLQVMSTRLHEMIDKKFSALEKGLAEHMVAKFSSLENQLATQLTNGIQEASRAVVENLASGIKEASQTAHHDFNVLLAECASEGHVPPPNAWPKE